MDQQKYGSVILSENKTTKTPGLSDRIIQQFLNALELFSP